MADEQGKSDKPSNPMDAWLQMRDASMSAWSKAMIDTVNTEQYAEASGGVLDTYLTNSAPFRAAFEKAMVKTLEQFSMPTRNDFISLAGRMTNIELRLDDMDAKLDRAEQASSKAASSLHKQVEKQFADIDAKLDRIAQSLSKPAPAPQAHVEVVAPKKQQKKGEL
jgi:polyhydroxyalkanoic acid synthase PhaR subunit